MNSVLKSLIVLAVLVLSAVGAQQVAADTCCWWCIEGVCVPQAPSGPGYHICISTYDPVGCMANQQSACTAGPDNYDLCGGARNAPLTTQTAIFKLSKRELDHLFEAGSSERVLRGFGPRFDCALIADRLAKLAAIEGRPELAYWHFSVGQGANAFGAADEQGTGYVFKAASNWGERHEVLLYSTDHRQRSAELAQASVSPQDLLLVRVSMSGQEYVLAMVARPVAEERLGAVQESFRHSIEEYGASRRLPLQLIGAQEAEPMFL